MRKSWPTVSNSPGALCRILSSAAGLIPGERTSATPRSVLQISDRHLRRYPIHIYTFSPAELSSERGEKEVLADSNQPTAPPSTKSHVSYCAARARRGEKMAAEGTSSTTG